MSRGFFGGYFVVGEHDVMFIGHGERIVLSHKAHSRMAFVSGAVEASFFLADKDTVPKSVSNKLN